MIRYTGEYGFERATEGSAGFDLRTTEDALIKPCQVVTVGTGIRVAIPDDHVGLVFVRSSVGKRGVTLANSVGVIDSDYRGEVKLALVNGSSSWQKVNAGDRVAQLVVVPFVSDIERVDSLDGTERGVGGFGSTGV